MTTLSIATDGYLCSGTGGGGGDTYLTGCLAVDVDLLLHDVDVAISNTDVGSTLEIYDVNPSVSVYNIDVAPENSEVDTTIEKVDLNGCS